MTFYLWTFSPREWMGYCGLEVSDALDAYMSWGGYPSVATEPDPARKSALLAELLRAYMDRDIESFLRVERMDAFGQMLRILARQAGQLVNLNEIAGTLKISHDTARRYLSYFQETFVIGIAPPFFRNLRSELTKMPKAFFTDLGLRNLLAGELRPGRTTAGAVAESFIYTALLNMVGADAIRYWRTEGKAEVDFVIEKPGGLIPVEVKAGAMGRAKVPTGLRSFIKAYQPGTAIVLNATLDATSAVGTTEVRFVSRERWLDALELQFVGKVIREERAMQTGREASFKNPAK
jgi:predicted AAA+ superfamily ATPase